MHKIVITSLILLHSLLGFTQDLKLGLPLGHIEGLNSAVFNPDGKLLLTASYDNTAKIWEVNSGRLLHSLEGHTYWVNSAVFSPDGELIVTASGDQTAKIWEVSSGRLLHTLEGHTYVVSSATFSPNGELLVTASWDHTAKIWEVSSGKLLHSLEGHSTEVNSAKFSPDGELIVTSSDDHTAKVWDVASGSLLHTLEGHSAEVNSAKFSPDGELIVTSSDDHTAKVWEVASGKLLHSLEGHTSWVNSAEFSSDGELISTASDDHTAKVWEVASGRLLHSLEGHAHEVNSAKFSPDGKLIVTASGDRTSKIWEVNSGRLLHTLEGHTWNLTSAVFRPDGKLIVRASWDGTAKIWKVNSGRLLHTLEGHSNEVNYAVFSPDGELIVTASDDNTAKIWEVTSGKLLHTLEGHSAKVNSAKFSPDGELIVTASWDHTAKVWEVASGRLLHSLEGHTQWVYSASFSPDGELIVTASDDHTAMIWEVNSGRLLHSLEGHSDWVYSASFSPDGELIVTESGDHTAKVWEVASGRLLHSLEGHSSWVSSAVFSPDGELIVTASDDNTAKIWEVTSGKLLHTLEGHSAEVNSAKFSPDGELIVTSSDDHTAKVWEVASGRLLHSLEGHTQWVYSASFSPDGELIVTASDDHTAMIWEVNSGRLLHSLEGHSAWVYSASFSPDGSKLLAGSEDGSIILWDVASGEQLIRSFTFDGDPNKWVHLHHTGLFDASPEGMAMMYWTKGLEVINFEQLKDRYWEPGLWEKVMRDDALRNTRGLNELKMQPTIHFGELQDNYTLPINLTKRDGGYGAVSIFINGKEVAADVRGEDLDTSLPQQTIYYNFENHPYLVDGNNTIEVSASSADGFIRGPKQTLAVEIDKASEDDYQPHFYGVIVGVSDYLNSTMNLTFPQYDAIAVDSAITLGAHNLFGTERTHIYSLTTEQQPYPKKENIKAVLDDISQQANPEDVIFIYLSGHGITWGGENGDFYFLTNEAISASSNAYNDPVLRNKVAIATSEWVDWLKAVAALKQVMVIDACGSGKAVDNLLAARDIEASQIKAIDRMKDRTGMFVLSGCAADASAYEASIFGQGLLTYTVLEAMKGAAIQTDGSVDIMQVMGHARERVPELARDIGGIQQPQMLFPSGGSIDIGILSEEDRQLIPLSMAKSVFVRSTFVDADAFEDVLGLMALVDDRLLQLKGRGMEAPLIFFDAADFPDACKLSGIYTQEEDEISLSLKVKCGEQSNTITLTAPTAEELAEEIMKEVIEP